jgi:hypothetical protein
MEPITIKHNFREVDWEKFRKSLERKLTRLSHPSPIFTQAQLDTACADITTVLQDTIQSEVPTTTLCAKTKRWWTKELTLLQRESQQTGAPLLQ